MKRLSVAWIATDNNEFFKKSKNSITFGFLVGRFTFTSAYSENLKFEK